MQPLETHFARVKSVAQYHVIFDLADGRRGMLHYRDTALSRFAHFANLFSVGQVAQLRVLPGEGHDGLLSLGLMQHCEPPWEHAEEAFPPGKVVMGKVLGHEAFGVRVELEPGVEALIPDELARRTFAVGEVIEARVVAVNAAARRIVLA